MAAPATKTKLGARPALPAGPDNLGSPTRVISTAIVIFLASQFAVLLITWLVAGLTHQNPTHLSNQDWYLTLTILLSEILVVAMVIRTVRGRGLSLGFIGLGRRPISSDVWKGILTWAAFMVVFVIIGMILNSVSPGLNQEHQDVGFNQINTSLDRSLAFVALVIFPPLGEEVLFRGYLFSGLRKLWRFWPALLVTSLLFGAPHLLEADSGLLWSGAIETFVLSAFLCFLRERTGALYAGILVHMLNNLIAFHVAFH